MADQRKKTKWSLDWGRIWESFLHVFILPSISNRLRKNVLLVDGSSDVNDFLNQALFIYFSNVDPSGDKSDLVFLIPNRISKDIVTKLYGEGSVKKSLKYFSGVTIIPCCLEKNVLLVKRKDATVIMHCEHKGNHVGLDIEPAFEDKWVKVAILDDINGE